MNEEEEMESSEILISDELERLPEDTLLELLGMLDVRSLVDLSVCDKKLHAFVLESHDLWHMHLQQMYPFFRFEARTADSWLKMLRQRYVEDARSGDLIAGMAPHSGVMITAAHGDTFKHFKSTNLRRGAEMCWSPRTNKLAVIKGDSIVISDITSLEVAYYPRTFCATVSASAFCLSWSPDGRRICWLDFEPSDRKRQLFVINVESSDSPPKPRIFARGQQIFYCWSPDAHSLLLHIGGELVEVNITEGASMPSERKLPDEPAPFMAPFGAIIRERGGNSAPCQVWVYARELSQTREIVLRRCREEADDDGPLAVARIPRSVNIVSFAPSLSATSLSRRRRLPSSLMIAVVLRCQRTCLGVLTKENGLLVTRQQNEENGGKKIRGHAIMEAPSLLPLSGSTFEPIAMLETSDPDDKMYGFMQWSPCGRYLCYFCGGGNNSRTISVWSSEVGTSTRSISVKLSPFFFSRILPFWQQFTQSFAVWKHNSQELNVCGHHITYDGEHSHIEESSSRTFDELIHPDLRDLMLAASSFCR